MKTLPPFDRLLPIDLRRGLLVVLVGAFSGLADTPCRAAASPAVSNAEAICGTWVLQQVGSRAELERLAEGPLAKALATPQVRGFCLRVPWKVIDRDFALLEAGHALAAQHKLAYSVRFMAGRHTPARVFERGCRYYTSARVSEKGDRHLAADQITGSGTEQLGASPLSRIGERVPAPFLEDGKPNPIFEEEYEKLVARLADWCRAHEVRLLHLAWYGQEWAELNHGREVRGLAGYSYERWLEAHRRLIDIGLKYADDGLAVELPFSGHGPLTDAAVALAEHVISRAGADSERFFCQANGWGPNGEWGAPAAETEAAFDRVWEQPIRRGLQMIQPQDYDWPVVFARLKPVRATYCEVYAPSFTLAHRAELAAEVAKFADACSEKKHVPQKADAEAAARPARQTRIGLIGGKWQINGAVTYPAAPAEGLLMNVRMVNATFEDRRRPDLDAEANTAAFLAVLPDYVAHGVRAFTLCLQGGMPGYEGAVNSAFNPDGSLRPEYLARVARVIEACDRQGAAVILGCYYQRQDQILVDEAAVRAGVRNVVAWIERQGYTNVMLEIANEFPHDGFDHRILRSPDGEAELIRLAKTAAPRLLVSTSGIGDGKLPAAVAEASDFLLIHFNGVALENIPARIAALKRYGKPIVCNEDDKKGEEAARAAELSVKAGASWGLMLSDLNQYFPLEFHGAADDPVVYRRLRELTGS